eukprot:scaffold149714_cov37-Tisochrysis_lutea.AAC.6
MEIEHVVGRRSNRGKIVCATMPRKAQPRTVAVAGKAGRESAPATPLEDVGPAHTIPKAGSCIAMSPS